MRDSYKEYLIPIIITLVILTLSFFLHLKWCGSSMRQSEEIWQERLDYHLNYYPFSIRYFTTYSALFVKNLFALPPRESFFIIQFLLAIIMGPLFYRYLRLLSFDKIWANIGLFLLYSAYPILGAHIEPVYTWDDFWVYIFLILTFTAIIKGRLLPASLFLTLGAFAREQTFLFWPVFVLASFWYCRNYPRWKSIIYIAAPLIIYLPFYYIKWQPFPGRTEFIIYNFETPLRGSDSIFSFLISFGVIWLTSAIGMGFARQKDRWVKSKLLIWGAILSVPTTAALTFFLTRARETRIFFPPFIFLIPLTIIFLQSVYEYFRKTMPPLKIKILFISLPVMLTIGIILAPLIFPAFEFRNCHRFHQQAFGFHLGLAMTIGIFYLMKIFDDRKKNGIITDS
ncbi:MAG: hypothetical protein NTV06_01600 [candidate division Zixibacteria bacterium]|nr:hypothetical protein [candidate division Zixibacteria bacterium]